MIRQSPTACRALRHRCIGPLIFLLALALLPPHAALAAASPAGGAAPSAQAPSIPLNLQRFASCHRRTPSGGPWTADENEKLSQDYNQENWPEVQTDIKKFLDDLDCTPQLPADGYYSVVFLNEGLTAPTLSRVLFHRDPAPEIYGNRVGSYDLYDLKLLPDLGITVTSVYQASTAPNGAIAQLPGVVSKLSGISIPPLPAGAPAPAAAAELIAPQPSQPIIIEFVINVIKSPDAFRGKIFATASVVPQVSVSDQLYLSAPLEAYMLDSLSRRATREDILFPGTIAKVNDNLVSSYNCCRNPKLPNCPSPNPPTTCPLEFPTVIQPVLAVNQELMRYATDLKLSYIGLFAFVTATTQPSTPPLSTQYTFGKLTRWSFSLGVGGTFPPFGNKPAKVVTNPDMTKSLESDPQSPTLTFVAVDFHPIRYDETKFSPTRAERFRFFGGIALTPKVGLVGGVGYSLIRGLTLEGGFAALLSNVVSADTKFGAPDVKVETHRGFYYVPFLALGYSFQ